MRRRRLFPAADGAGLRRYSPGSALRRTAVLLALAALILAGCRPPAAGEPADVLAVESFLADLAANVAGERLAVAALIPRGVDPHAFEPAPSDAARLQSARALLVNGCGFEAFLESTLAGASAAATASGQIVISACDGLTPRPSTAAGDGTAAVPQGEVVDAHFWLDPQLAMRYVENIRIGLTRLDPDGAQVYARNAQAYTAQLAELDASIAAQIARIPPERRRIVTNHESFGYYADRYGLTITGVVLPGAGTEVEPSARRLAELVATIRASGSPAIFLETGANPELAQQLQAETGARVVSDLYTHSLSAPDGPAPTYIEMMRYNTEQIVAALSAGPP